jgi:DnaJ-class molecular chaperone
MNPYKVLGLTEKATQEEIKKAYRSLAKKNHPDLNPGNLKAEAKFKEISHANDLIGTKENRAKYDRGELDEQNQRDWQQQNANKRNTKSSRSNASSHYSRNQFDQGFSFEDFFNSHQAQAENKSNLDTHYSMNISFQESIIGTEKNVTLASGKNLKVKIPPGIESGTKLRFNNQGLSSKDNNYTGDAYIEIRVETLEGWVRIGNDIETEIAISYLEGILGTEISVPTMHGQVMLKIPSGVSTGSKLRIKGKGVVNEKALGNQIVKIKVVLPKTVSPELKGAILKLKNDFDYNPRT